MKKMALIIAFALAASGCGMNNYVAKVAVGTPSEADCAKFAALGEKAVKAGDKAEVAAGASLSASPLYAPFATVASAIQVAVAGGEKMYELGEKKYAEKCVARE